MNSIIATTKRWKHHVRDFIIRWLVIVLALLGPLDYAASGDRLESAGDFDAPPDARNLITDTLSYGGNAELELELEQNFDLDSKSKDDLAIFQPTLELAFAYRPNRKILAFANFELSKELEIIEEGKDRDRPTKFILDQFYVELSGDYGVATNVKNTALRLGRQKFKDQREWYYDQELDAVRLFFELFNVDIEVSASREEIVGRDLANPDKTDPINNYVVSTEYQATKNIIVGAFLIARNDLTKDDEDPIFIGLRFMGEPVKQFEYWADFATVRGSDESDKIRGYGFDIGATYTFDTEFSPSLTIAYALGSGDSNSKDGKDTSFRQTGLQDNSAKFGGVVRLQYYGELLDPELSNLGIFTAAVGIRPTKKSSIALVYHQYRQDEASDELRDAQIDKDPDGEHKQLGSEIDLVAGYKKSGRLKFELSLGYFMPGRAFSKVDDAFFTKFEMKYNF